MRALGVTFDYQKRPVKVLQTYQQAIPYLDHVSPLLRARMYALLAGAYAKVGQKQEAFTFLDQAYHVFPDRPQDDPSFLYADAGRFTLTKKLLGYECSYLPLAETEDRASELQARYKALE